GVDHELHSFPTRRSADLSLEGVGKAEVIREDFRDVVIRVDEFETVALIQTDSGFHPVLADGTTFSRTSDTPPPAPVLSEFEEGEDRKSTRLNSSHVKISY